MCVTPCTGNGTNTNGDQCVCAEFSPPPNTCASSPVVSSTSSPDETCRKSSIDLSSLALNQPACAQDDNTTPPAAVDNFMAFVTDGALQKAERSFPISGIGDLQDPKTKGTPAIGVPQGTDLGKVFDLNALRDADAEKIRNGQSPETVTFKDGKAVRIISIPASIDEGGFTHIDATKIPDQNFLIYMPKRYVVATSNSLHREAYPHDSSYVLSAMIRYARSVESTNPELSRRYLQSARDMLDNFAYETKEFGFPLNGNRGYYLSRSQTNNLATNVWEYYQATGDKKWLEEVGLPMAVAIDKYWNSGDGQIKFDVDGETYIGNRWIAHGAGPCQEVWESHGAHNAYYFRVLDTLVQYKQEPDADRPQWARGFDYGKVVEEIPAADVAKWKEKGLLKSTTVKGDHGMEGRMFVLNGSVNQSGRDEPIIMRKGDDGRPAFFRLTSFYYTSDRASRASGYDSNHLYGPFNAFTSDFVSTAQNIQLYDHAKSIAQMYVALGDKHMASAWKGVAAERKRMVMNTMWNADEGMLFDYDAATGKQRTDYPFASSCYAIWAGLFDVSKPAERVQLMSMVAYMEQNLEGPNGLYASGVDTGMHWDKPFSWPIQQGMVVRGLRDYAAQMRQQGFNGEADHLAQTADRIAIKYLEVNYRHWAASKGKEVKEKVGPDSGVFTGYENGDNYTWNMAAVWDLYDGLTPAGKQQFHAYVEKRGSTAQPSGILRYFASPSLQH